MKNIKLLLLLFFLPFDGISFAQDSTITVTIKTHKNNNIPLSNQAIYNTNGKAFFYNFKVPRNTETIVNIVSSLDSLEYSLYLAGDSLSELDSWGLGKAFAVSVKEYVKLGKAIGISSDGRQPYIHDNNLFTSFNRIDSINDTLLLGLDFNKFRDYDGTYFKDGKAFKLKKLKGSKLYILMEVIVDDKKGKITKKEFAFVLKF